MKRLLHAAGWVGLAIGVAAAVLVVLPLQPSFILPTLDDSFAATLHYAAAHRGEPGTALISTYGPLGFVHYPLYLPETFTALVWWRLAMAALLVAPLAWLGWAATESPWGAAVAVAAATPFLAGDDLRGVLVPNLAVLVELVPRRRPSRWVLILLGAALAVMALTKGTFLVLGVAAMIPSVVAALRPPRRVPWMPIAALATATLIWLALGLGPRDAAAFLGWSLGEIAPGYASAMQIPAKPPLLLAEALAASALLLLVAGLVARRATPTRWPTAATFGLLLFLAFKVGFVRAEVHMFITVDLLILNAVLVSLLWAGARPWRVLGAALLLGAMPVALFAQIVATGVLPVGPYRIVTPREMRLRGASLPRLVDPGLFATTHEQYAAMIRVGRPLPALDGPVDVYPCEQSIALAHGLPLRSRPVFQSYMAYTPRLAHENAAWLASDQAAPWILFRSVSIDNRLSSQDDAASWPLLLSQYDPVPPIDVFAVLRRRSTQRAWQLAPLARQSATTGEPIAVPRAPRVWARIDVQSTWQDAVAAALLAPPTPWMTITYADGHSMRRRLVPALARDGFLLSPYINSATEFAALLDSTPPPPARDVTQIQVDLVSPLGGGWSPRPVTVEFFEFQIEATPGA